MTGTGKTAVKTGTVALTPRRPPNGITIPSSHIKPELINPVVWMCIGCIVCTTLVALWKIVFGNDTSIFPYTLATVCTLGSFLVLAAFFGKNGKTGAISTSG